MSDLFPIPGNTSRILYMLTKCAPFKFSLQDLDQSGGEGWAAKHGVSHEVPDAETCQTLKCLQGCNSSMSVTLDGCEGNWYAATGVHEVAIRVDMLYGSTDPNGRDASGGPIHVGIGTRATELSDCLGYGKNQDTSIAWNNTSISGKTVPGTSTLTGARDFRVGDVLGLVMDADRHTLTCILNGVRLGCVGFPPEWVAAGEGVNLRVSVISSRTQISLVEPV
jgi:hypothetical protein